MSLPARSSRTMVTPPAVPMPGMAGGEKAKATPCGSFAKLPVQVGHDGLVLLLRVFPLLPGFEGDEEEPAVGVGDAAQHAVTGHGRAVFHARGRHDDLLHLPDGSIGPLKGRGIRQLDAGVHVPWSSSGRKPPGTLLADKARATGHKNEQEETDHELADEPRRRRARSRWSLFRRSVLNQP